MRKIAIGAAALGLLLAPLAGTASAAGSQEDLAGEKAVVLKVDAAKDKTAALKALSPHERDLLQQSIKHMTHSTSTKVVSSGQATRTGTVASGAVTPNIALDGGCWSQYWYDDWYDFTVKTGSTWMEADWCSDGYNITSYWTTNVGAQGAGTNSFEGLGSSGARDVGWEVRQYQEFHFNFWGVDAYPCMQIRGGATGLYSEQESCNVS